MQRGADDAAGRARRADRRTCGDALRGRRVIDAAAGPHDQERARRSPRRAAGLELVDVALEDRPDVGVEHGGRVRSYSRYSRHDVGRDRHGDVGVLPRAGSPRPAARGRDRGTSAGSRPRSTRPVASTSARGGGAHAVLVERLDHSAAVVEPAAHAVGPAPLHERRRPLVGEVVHVGSPGCCRGRAGRCPACPSLVMIPVRAARRSSTALRPSVVPWMNSSDCLEGGCRERRRRRGRPPTGCRRGRRLPEADPAGPRSSSMASTKVPPMSTASRRRPSGPLGSSSARAQSRLRSSARTVSHSGACGFDQLEMSRALERDEGDLVAGGARGVEIGEIRLVMDVVGSDDEHLPDPERQPGSGRGVRPAVRMHGRGAAEQARDQTVVVAPAVRRLEVDHAGERDDAVDREGRPAQRPRARGDRRRSARQARRGQGRAGSAWRAGARTRARLDVVEGARPAAAGVAEAPVLDVPRRDAVGGEVDAQVPGMGQVVDRLPVAAVEHDDERERPAACRQAQVTELEWLVAVDDTRVGVGRRRLGQDCD